MLQLFLLLLLSTYIGDDVTVAAAGVLATVIALAAAVTVALYSYCVTVRSCCCWCSTSSFLVSLELLLLSL